MSGATDSGMVKTMGVVMGALAILAVLSMFAARMLSGDEDSAGDPMIENALIKRISPVAAVRTSADDLPASAPMAVASLEPRTTDELVNGMCASCHTDGVAGAPKFDDAAEWGKRADAGLDALVASVINGKGSMPARGGSDYSDEEIKRAVQQMVGFEVSEMPVTEATENAVEEATETVETAVEEAAETVEAAKEVAAETVETAVEEATAAVAATAGTAVVLGEMPEGLTDSIKASVDSSCASCHLAGVADAPKIGDKEAWQIRADKGLEALTASVINGMNVMPPRGASTLTDEEIPIAIQYLMSK